VDQPFWGATNAPFIRIAPPLAVPAPNPREISNLVCKTSFHETDPINNMMSIALGNFVVHDFALTKAFMPKIPINVPVLNPKDDLFPTIEMSASNFVFI